MITCKLCGTSLNRKSLRRDGSLLCPVCGQIYWKSALEKAGFSTEKQQMEAPKHVVRKPAFGRV
ncbi:MAG: hypothetical protein IJQ02_12855 [Oscillospiraceae bacterium]|nr:hypothetical protein [Oscillospiraceae bacterium]